MIQDLVISNTLSNGRGIDFARHDLDVSRLNNIHEYLWLAERPTRARTLHDAEENAEKAKKRKRDSDSDSGSSSRSDDDHRDQTARISRPRLA